MYLTVWSKLAKFYRIMVIAVRLGFGSLFGAEKQKKSVGFFGVPSFLWNCLMCILKPLATEPCRADLISGSRSDLQSDGAEGKPLLSCEAAAPSLRWCLCVSTGLCLCGYEFWMGALGVFWVHTWSLFNPGSPNCCVWILSCRGRSHALCDVFQGEAGTILEVSQICNGSISICSFSNLCYSLGFQCLSAAW